MTSLNPLRSYQRSLHLVLVLSIIGSGFSCLGAICWALFMPTLQEVAAKMPEVMQSAYEMMFSIPRVFYVVLTLLYAVSLAGAILLWNYRRIGLHAYTLAQILVLIVKLLFLGRGYVGIGDIMITVLFVGYYFITLRSIERLSAEGEDAPSDNSEGE